ncbi:hypothetical protein Cgig2_020628 [Carnegiea gigantea]|uniref:Uncharacterized protein n=1 Tax=Carnegiea gigantea TaxID=171969 RepID=A0A9Q1GYC3_9CARY|nr:hypothetical protein Cgig2_020628 [Carnegiea gigantea]
MALRVPKSCPGQSDGGRLNERHMSPHNYDRHLTTPRNRCQGHECLDVKKVKIPNLRLYDGTANAEDYGQGSTKDDNVANVNAKNGNASSHEYEELTIEENEDGNPVVAVQVSLKSVRHQKKLREQSPKGERVSTRDQTSQEHQTSGNSWPSCICREIHNLLVGHLATPLRFAQRRGPLAPPEPA